MMIYELPKKTLLEITLDARNGSPPTRRDIQPGQLTRVETNLEIERLLKACEIPFKRYDTIRLRLSDPRLTRFATLLTESWNADKLGIRSCYITEPLPKPSPEDWYDIDSGMTELKTTRRPPRNLALCAYWGGIVVSQRFLECVKKHGLTGLEAIEVEQWRPTDPEPWYEVFATAPLGRGLDHPLLDRPKHESKWRHANADLPWTMGSCMASADEWKSGASLEPPLLASLLPMSIDPGRFQLRRASRAVREYLPATDFAIHGWSAPQDDRPDEPDSRRRGLACSTRARDVLVAEGLLRPSHLSPIITVTAAKADSPILDERIPAVFPPPLYTPDELHRERQRRAAARASDPGTASRREPVLLTDVLAILQRRAQEKSLPWEPVGESHELVSVRRGSERSRVPQSWQAVVPFLPHSFDCEDDQRELFEFELAAPTRNDWSDDESDLPPDLRPSPDDIVIGHIASGDWYAIRPTDPLMPDDARVTHWSHETGTITDEWPNVAAFVNYMMQLADKNSS
jgi:hypothetical protein